MGHERRQRRGECRKMRGGMVAKWKETAKEHKKDGAIASKEDGAIANQVRFHALFKKWLEVRDLGDSLQRDANVGDMLVYKCVGTKFKKYDDSDTDDDWGSSWRSNEGSCEDMCTAFHGTFWYALWSVIFCGSLLESHDGDLGHDHLVNEPGVYVAPKLDTALGYARTHNLFDDGCYHQLALKVRVDRKTRTGHRKRSSGHHQWIFNRGDVEVHAIYVKVNSQPAAGDERLRDWDAHLEVLPPTPNVERPAQISSLGLRPQGEVDIRDKAPPHPPIRGHSCYVSFDSSAESMARKAEAALPSKSTPLWMKEEAALPSSDEDSDGRNPWCEDGTVEDLQAASSRQPFHFRVPQAGSPLADLGSCTTQELEFALVGEGLKCNAPHADLVKLLHEAPAKKEKAQEEILKRPWRRENKESKRKQDEAQHVHETSMPGPFCHYDRLRKAWLSPVPVAEPETQTMSNILLVEIPTNVDQRVIAQYFGDEYGFVELDFVSDACCRVVYRSHFWANRAKTAIEQRSLIRCTFARPAKTLGDSSVPCDTIRRAREDFGPPASPVSSETEPRSDMATFAAIADSRPLPQQKDI